MIHIDKLPSRLVLSFLALSEQWFFNQGYLWELLREPAKISLESSTSNTIRTSSSWMSLNINTYVLILSLLYCTLLVKNHWPKSFINIGYYNILRHDILETKITDCYMESLCLFFIVILFPHWQIVFVALFLLCGKHSI